jgi:fructosamine-3-kinase
VSGHAGGGIAGRLERLTGTGVSELQPTGSQFQYRHYRATLAGGRVVFVKAAAEEQRAALRAEARGLDWLGAAGAVPVPDVVGWDEFTLVISWVPAGAADAASAGRFGRDLALMHAAGAGRFGAPWPGFIASLPLPNDGPPAGEEEAAAWEGTAGEGTAREGTAREGTAREGTAREGTAREGAGGWPDWYASRRLLPYLRRAADAGTLGPAHVRLVDAVLARITELAGPAEPPSRIHGDCWSGNVLWSGGRGWLIDPAAHGGHRETDLAMLALFGAPFLDRILASYAEVAPLAAGWRARVPLHQLHPLLVHVCLFGAGYAGPVAEAARAALAA